MFPAPAVSIVVPTYNERENIPLLAERLANILSAENPDWELIVVDDNSPDGTWQAAKDIGQRDRRLRTLRRIGRKGLSGAVTEGILASSARYVVVMDGDLQHDEALLPQIIGKLEAGADIVIASRYVKGGSSAGLSSGMRHLLSRLGNQAAQSMISVRSTDPMSGFFGLRRDKFEECAPLLTGKGFKILFDLLALLPKQTKLEEVPLIFRERQHGASKLGAGVFLQALKQAVILSVRKRFRRAGKRGSP